MSYAIKGAAFITIIGLLMLMSYTNIQSFKQTEAMTRHFEEAVQMVEQMKQACRNQKQAYPPVHQIQVEVETVLWTI